MNDQTISLCLYIILLVILPCMLVGIFLMYSSFSDDIDLLKKRLKELERWANSQYDKQRKTRKPHRENRRNQRFVTEADIANQGERDLIGEPYWWLQFCYDENLKQENPVLYTILEAFAKDEQRRYKEENEKCS